MRITSDYIRGFVDGEGCFYILNSKRIACEFQVSQKRRAVLDQMQKFFGCGYVKSKYDKAGTFVYLVKSIADLKTKVVPFFWEHPLIVKREQFEKFAEAVELQSKKLHLTNEGKKRIAQLKVGILRDYTPGPSIAR
jgi:intein-encoded DNA endonuclease-like protein